MQRRDFATRILGIGVGLTTVGSAAGTRENTIRHRIRSLMMEGKLTEARELADEYNIEYMYSKQTLSNTEGGVSTNDYLDKGNSTLQIFAIDIGNNKYVVQVDAKLSNNYWDIPSAANPKDGLSLTFSDNFWQPVSQSASNVTLYGDQKYINYKDYKRYGVWVKIDDQAHRKDSFGNNDLDVGFVTELEKVNNTNKFNLNAEYLHTWNLGGIVWVTNFSLGPFGLDLSGVGLYDWRLEVTEKA
jgi:hypothetical protein